MERQDLSYLEEQPDTTKTRPDQSAVIMLVCTALLLMLTVSLIVTMIATAAGKNRAHYATIEEAAELIESEYYFFGEQAENTLTADAIRGMLSGIDDPYAQYFTEEEYAELLSSNAGSYHGIGISVTAPDETGAVILTVYPDTPMSEAGALDGDVILNVNGTDVGGLAMNDFLALFSTDDAVSDTVVLLRGKTRFTVTVTRRAVHVARVHSELLEQDVGYIRIDEFNGSVVTEFWAALTALRGQGATKLVLDLRNNPGGGLNEVLGVAGYLIPKDAVICTIKSRRGTQDVYKSSGNDRISDMPIAVLVNGNSASASELLSGALQAHGIATVVGTQTFGKGIVQSYYHLKQNAGWVKLTTDAYYTPDDVCIHGVGITPDLTVESAEAYRNTAPGQIPRSEDLQLIAALDALLVEQAAA